MAEFTEDGYLTRLAGADLSDKQFYIVKMSTGRTVVLATAATDFLFGVIHKGSTSGGAVSIASRNTDGTFKVAAGNTFSQGAYLTADSTGRAVATTTPNDEIIGVACEAATVAGQIVEYLPLARKY